jgi:hypothetical protein
MNGSTWTAAVIYAITFGIAVVVTAAATPLIVRLARHLGVLDTKDEERRVHEVPTPRIGGVAVFFGFACALFAVLGFALASPLALLPSAAHLTAAHQIELLTDRFASVHQLVGLLFGSLLILAVGIWDDVIGNDLAVLRLRHSGRYESVRPRSELELDRVSVVGRHPVHIALVRRDDERDQFHRRSRRPTVGRGGDFEHLHFCDFDIARQSGGRTGRDRVGGRRAGISAVQLQSGADFLG